MQPSSDLAPLTPEMGSPAIDDRKLIDDFARRRDDVAFRRLYRRYTPRMFGLALRLTAGSRPDAEELVQEAWVRAVERMGTFEFRSSLSTWLSGFVVNCYREWRRARARAPDELDEVTENRVATNVALLRRSPTAADRRIDVERAIAELPDGYREVVVLYHLNGFTHREIAEHLQIDEGTSKSQLSRARARLRRRLTAPAGPPSDCQGSGPR